MQMPAEAFVFFGRTYQPCGGLILWSTARGPSGAWILAGGNQ